jgi:hypothetical protein
VTTRRRDRVVGAALIIVGALLGSLIILAAFTPIGLIAAPAGLAMIVLGALRLDRASRADA